jgi:hypothetical protein
MTGNVTTTFELENIVVTVSADVEPTDYGVRGNPGTVDISNIRIESVQVLGHDIPLSALPSALMADLLDHAAHADFDE